MQFTFHHIALSVKDIEESVAFYEKLNMKQISDYAHDDGSFKIVQLKFGAAILELFWFNDAEDLPIHAKELATDLRVVGTKHFGFKVADLDEALKHIQSLGIEVASEPTAGKTGVRYFFIKDPDGILVEISQDNRDL